ncbi:MAG: peptidoglycan editing factor PgeF [Anaerolineales bacterium]|nr:peptidoglycan editing factor PgeF [Anaerolineales bacterium]
MPFTKSNGLNYYQFPSLMGLGVQQAVFTRHGGVSQGVWNSLNVGLTVGDDPARVAQNRKIIFEAIGRPVQSLSDSWLVHGRQTYKYDHPRPSTQEFPPKADIILTNNPEVSLFMRYADCVPILLVDPVRRAIALAHAGWQGTVQQVGRYAVEAMQSEYGTRPDDILAAIGPSIGPERYEVGPEVVRQVGAAFGENARSLLPRFGASTHLDLWAANRLTLEIAGVRQIEVAGLCTAENQSDWFSHRAEAGKTGRFGVLLALEE